MPAQIVWDGGPTGQGTDWLDPVNWAGDVLPGPNDDAVLGPASAGQPTEITLDGSAAVRSATVTGVTLRLANATLTGSLVNQGTVLALSGTSAIAGALTTTPGSTLQVGSNSSAGSDVFLTIPGDFTNRGAIELNRSWEGGDGDMVA